MSANQALRARQRAREKNIEVKGHVFTIRRPKFAEMLDDHTRLDLVKRFVVDWDLKGSDLSPDGAPEPVPFDVDLFADFVEDDPDYWKPLGDAIVGEWNAYLKARGDAEKNSSAG